MKYILYLNLAIQVWASLWGHQRFGVVSATTCRGLHIRCIYIYILYYKKQTLSKRHHWPLHHLYIGMSQGPVVKCAKLISNHPSSDDCMELISVLEVGFLEDWATPTQSLPRSEVQMPPLASISALPLPWSGGSGPAGWAQNMVKVIHL